ncbi:MAG TPA: class I SAM-dependent methyltransferase [Spirochaetia bacterium]|nr:class I SAM-dependent methyltransferase [Spirochaetia bacterium]
MSIPPVIQYIHFMNSGGAGLDMFMAPLERLNLRALRSRLVARATGRVLEVGAGTGVNISHYNRQTVESLHVSDMDLHYGRVLRRRRAVRPLPFPVRFTDADVQRLPFEDASFDTVVFTLLFCSVADPDAGLAEIRRVLAPGGQLIFIEHVLPSARTLSALFRHITPAWRRVAGNCHLDRATVPRIRNAGFTVRIEAAPGLGIFVGGTGIRTT